MECLCIHLFPGKYKYKCSLIDDCQYSYSLTEDNEHYIGQIVKVKRMNSTAQSSLSKQLQAVQAYLIKVRRALHRVPELAFQEQQTAEIIIKELENLDIPFDYQGVGEGVIGRINCGIGDAPTVALRAEMDALPGDENTGLAFSSKNQGKVHACGHDAHMAMLIGAAMLLKQQPAPINTMLIFQPAEESGGGSRRVLESGALKGVSAIFAGHVTHHYSLGEIMLGHGVITAQSDRFDIHIRGKGKSVV